MPATTMVLHKRYVLTLSHKPMHLTYWSRNDVASAMRLAKEGDVKLDIQTVWSMDLDNGRGDEWYQSKWESLVCGRPGFEGV